MPSVNKQGSFSNRKLDLQNKMRLYKLVILLNILGIVYVQTGILTKSFYLRHLTERIQTL